MISKINVVEILKRLEKETEHSKSFATTNLVFFKPYKKKFLGTFDESSFQITKQNSSMADRVPFYINGIMRAQNGNKTEIEYELLPIWLDYFGKRIFIVFLFALNFAIAKNSNKLFDYLILNIILLIVTFGVFWLEKKLKGKLENDFRELLEIE
ncbi:MAG: hypothetical protein PSV16_06155 [Flavobacterium sp.]|nr:hypothetical protein [Flavobacterium sp.]